MTKLSKSEASDRKSTNETISSALRNICVTRPSAKLAVGKKGSSSETIDKIIASAREVFTEDGHSGLSLRKVAENAGVAVGNLTYHFPSKRSLLNAMLEEARAEYAQVHLKLFEDPTMGPFDILLTIMENYVIDGRKSHQFFLQMWGYAASDEDAKTMVRNFYHDQSRILYYLVRDCNPDLNHDQRRRAVAQMSGMEEGFKMYFGLNIGVETSLLHAEKMIREMTKQIVFPESKPTLIP